METHHHKADCRIHKELPANTEAFKYCPTPEESHHCSAIVFPVEILAKDVSVIWQSSVHSWKNRLPWPGELFPVQQVGRAVLDTIKSHPCLGWEEMATHCSVLAGESHRQRSLVGYSPQVHKELDMTE